MPRDPVQAVVGRHARSLLALPGVVGVAEGETGGRPCITVYVAVMTTQVTSRIPADLEGWPVVARESGELRALGE
jgi:hypothetical protein